MRRPNVALFPFVSGPLVRRGSATVVPISSSRPPVPCARTAPPPPLTDRSATLSKEAASSSDAAPRPADALVTSSEGEISLVQAVQLYLEMLAHGLASNPLRATRSPLTPRASSAPLGLVSSLGFNRGCKEKVKLFINVDRYTKYNAPSNTQRCSRISPLATASFGDMADSSTPIFPRIHVKDPYQRLGISKEASEEEIRAARNFLISKYAGHKPSVDAIESAHDKIIMQSFFDRKKPKVDLKKKFRELSQSRPVKAVQGRFYTPSSKFIWKTAITFVLLGVLTLVFPTEEGPTLQVLVSCAANIYFLYQRLKSGWKSFFYGFGSFFASWFLATFLMVSVIPPILPGPRNLEVSTACVAYAFLFVSSTFLK